MAEDKYIPDPNDPNPPETTRAALVFGLILAVFALASSMYLGLKAGMTVGYSIPSAIIALGFFRGIRKKGTILECNIVQTMASTGETLAAGVIFTIPALKFAQIWTDFSYLQTTIVAIAGGCLGVLMMIPLREPLIVHPKPEVTYPEGTACGKILLTFTSGLDALKKIGLAMGIGAFVKLLTHAGLIADDFMKGIRLGSSGMPIAFTTSPAMFSIGYIVGANVALLVFAGGALAWMVITPIVAVGHIGSSDDVLASLVKVWRDQVRYVGVGAMIVAAVATIWRLRFDIRDSLKTVITPRTAQVVQHRTTTDMGSRTLKLCFALVAAVVCSMYVYATGGFWAGMITAIIMIPFAFVIVAVSSYICGLVGSSNNPISGMTIFSLLLAAFVIFIMGVRDNEAVRGTLLVAAVVCCAAATAGNTSQDLMTGKMVKATPWKQQAVCLLAVVASAFFVVPVLGLLESAYGWNAEQGGMGAPQAHLFAALAQGFFDPNGHIEWGFVTVGMIIGVCLVAFDNYLDKNKKPFRAYVMPLAVGMYLPLAISVTICMGGLVRYWLDKGKKKAATPEEEAAQAASTGVLFGSGVIAGESLTALVLGIIMFLKSPMLFGAIALAAFGWFFFRTVKKGDATPPTPGDEGGAPTA